jgi:hypothetical protein
MSKKIDFKKEDKALYHAKASTVSEIYVPELSYLMLDGRGDPNGSEEFANACQALFAVSYKIKFQCKKGDLAIDYAVMPLEGLWWVDEGDFSIQRKNDLRWTLMIRQPDFVTEHHMMIAKNEVMEKKKSLLKLSDLRLERYTEGEAVQILHVGAYANEQPTIDVLHEHMRECAYTAREKHHEIYLNDPTRTQEEKLKTLIRQPIDREE